jgi:hypothetical protein
MDTERGNAGTKSGGEGVQLTDEEASIAFAAMCHRPEVPFTLLAKLMIAVER